MLGLLFATLAHAALVHDGAVWTSETLTPTFGEAAVRPALWLDLHQRSPTGPGFTGIVRPGVGVDVGRGWTLWAGYAWVPSSDGEAWRHEHRAWQQAWGAMRVDRVALGARLRLEQRVRDGDRGVGLRARLWGRLGIAVGGPVSVVVTDEAFFGLNRVDWAPQGFDQNRAFAGVALVASEPFRIELGYLNVYLHRATSIMTHAGAVNLFLTPRIPPPAEQP